MGFAPVPPNRISPTLPAQRWSFYNTTRASCPGDARGTNAVLTEAGRARLRAAAPTHLRGVAEHMTDRLSADELTTLRALMTKLLVEPVSPPEGGCGGAEGL